MLKYIDAPFEDKSFMIPMDYDYQLSIIFGDYMRIPPENERYNHNATAYWK